MLTRIYGLAFENKKELDDYLSMQVEAEKRDHRKLGKELQIFTFDRLYVNNLLSLFILNNSFVFSFHLLLIFKINFKINLFLHFGIYYCF